MSADVHTQILSKKPITSRACQGLLEVWSCPNFCKIENSCQPPKTICPLRGKWPERPPSDLASNYMMSHFILLLQSAVKVTSFLCLSWRFTCQNSAELWTFGHSLLSARPLWVPMVSSAHGKQRRKSTTCELANITLLSTELRIITVPHSLMHWDRQRLSYTASSVTAN